MRTKAQVAISRLDARPRPVGSGFAVGVTRSAARSLRLQKEEAAAAEVARRQAAAIAEWEDDFLELPAAPDEGDDADDELIAMAATLVYFAGGAGEAARDVPDDVYERQLQRERIKWAERKTKMIEEYPQFWHLSLRREVGRARNALKAARRKAAAQFCARDQRCKQRYEEQWNARQIAD